MEKLKQARLRLRPGAQQNGDSPSYLREARRRGVYALAFILAGARLDFTRFPKDLRNLIRRIAAENLIWGEERIANELKLKLGIRVSPRTIGKYLNNGGSRREPDPNRADASRVGNQAPIAIGLHTGER